MAEINLISISKNLKHFNFINNWSMLMNNRLANNKYLTVLLLGPLVLLLPLAMDIYVPAIPELINIFKTTPMQMQYTLSLFLIIVSVGQLIMGPLSDQWGRIKPALLSIFIFIIGSILSMFTASVFQLLLCRSVQAIGACGAYVIAFAIIRDQFDGKESAEVFAYINGMLAVSPVIGPIIGSALDMRFGWQAEFGALAVAGILALIAMLIQHETLAISSRRPITRALFKRYIDILLHTLLSICL